MGTIISAAGPATGNISANVYIIIGIIAAVVMIITVAAGIIGKKNKK
ncbi:MAG: LPXTG cell wall anchor domain-containing protein [Oscillospiraceae bacterium]|nr:LPXTG cell wall anchor domain-containing protein [Oscillospiraceae bacterium]MDD7429885.1 LPXTG cell wall anchor domain-containing protein [Oscillospiraceae bacterium]MDY2848508.1 LPXTG cell wall anchor domain-containing protein [Oscillospiraceae bacterium]